MDPNLTERQREILDFITQFQGDQGYFPSLREIGAHFKLSLGTVQTHLDYLKRKGALDWEKGKSRAMKVTRPSLEAESGLGFRAVQALSGVLDGFLQIPILGRVSAGPGLLAEENVEDTLTLPRNFFRYQPGEVFGLKVKGDSMVGSGIFEGDTVLVRMQKEAQDREIVVALLGDEALVKIFRREGGGIFLYSSNPAYPPRQVGENFRVLGKVIQLLRSY